MRRQFENTVVIMMTRSLRPGAPHATGAGTRAGTVVAVTSSMAAVLCLMFLPLMFATMFLLSSMGSISVGVILAGATFVMLGSGLVFGALRLATGWERE